MMPLGRSSSPSPATRLKSQPTHERADKAGDEGHAPVDLPAVATEDQLRPRADEHPEQDETDDQHGAGV